MIMDGPTHDVGAVGCLRRIKNAISVARKVLEHTQHSFLVGDLATEFAIKFGFKQQSLASNKSTSDFQTWVKSSCQPNFWKNVQPDSKTTCGPYDLHSLSHTNHTCPSKQNEINNVDENNHDTISMIVIDSTGRVAAGSSTNGLIHKIPGRVGDSPIPGSGAYVDQDYGAAAATGDGDVMMRFNPSYHAVEMIRSFGMSPKQAADDAMRRIQAKYKTSMAAIIVANSKGEYGASCTGYKTFPWVVANPSFPESKVMVVECI